jgi:hypothetical protein
MGSTAPKRALQNYRKRLSKEGLARFEVLGLDSDRELVRAFARRLAENNPEAAEIRTAVRNKIVSDTNKKGGVYAALRRWPIADLNLSRPAVKPRKINL